MKGFILCVIIGLIAPTANASIPPLVSVSAELARTEGLAVEKQIEKAKRLLIRQLQERGCKTVTTFVTYDGDKILVDGQCLDP